ncbi:MAG: transketolase [Bacteroidetes bacterium]|nr:MAG: transketolase [Bacteroidota bacterium]
MTLTNKELAKSANELRNHIVDMIYTANSGHPGSSLSNADLVTVLYYDEMNIDPSNPKWKERDRFLLSKGHACPTLYAVLAMRGYFEMDHLSKLRKIDGILQGHPDMKKTPGVDYTTGSLGNGLSIGVGMALAARLDKKAFRTYVMLGCGEMQEGIVWEAMMSAAKYNTDNLCAIIDYNQLQLDGNNDQVMPVKSLKGKILSFNWHVISCDGHDMSDIRRSFAEARNMKGRPTAIIANTIKGKGVSYMENKVDWHGVVPNEEEYEQAKRELEASNE